MYIYINIFCFPQSMQIDNKESEPAQSFRTQQDLGLSFLGAIYERLKRSKDLANGTYYCFIDQLYNAVHVVTLISSVKLLCEEVELSLIQLVCLWISEFLVYSPEALDDRGLLLTVGANILVSMHHPSIFSQFPIEKIAIVKLIKVEKQQGLCYEYIYLCRCIFFFCLGLCVVFPNINKHKDNLTICMHSINIYR